MKEDRSNGFDSPAIAIVSHFIIVCSSQLYHGRSPAYRHMEPQICVFLPLFDVIFHIENEAHQQKITAFLVKKLRIQKASVCAVLQMFYLES